MSKEEFEQWAFEQMQKYGIRHPDTFTEDEIAYACPEVPRAVIKQHVKKRDAR
jgi:hypothetical protein